MPAPLLHHEAGNPYFTDPNGNAVYLAGSHHWANLQDGPWMNPSTFDYQAYLDRLSAHHHNLIRLWAWESAKGAPWDSNWPISPVPFARSSTCCAQDGGNKFDLTRFNQAYFDRLRDRVIQAGNRGIYVQVLLFNGWATWNRGMSGNPFLGHPFNPMNNVTGVGEDPVFLHTLRNGPVVQYQKKYVEKVLDTLHDLSNVMYEIANESDAGQLATPAADSRDWQYELINHIHQYESQHGYMRHLVNMSKGPMANGQVNPLLYSGPADTISPGDSQWGGSGYDYVNNPPAPDSFSKVVAVDTDHIFGVGGDGAWIWKVFLRGNGGMLYMDPYHPGENKYGATEATLESARVAMGQTVDYSKRLNLKLVRPHGELTSTGYMLATPGSEYLAFTPGAAFTVNLAPGNYAIEWLSIATGQKLQGNPLQGGGTVNLAAPFAGPAVAYLKAAAAPPPPPTYLSDLTPTHIENGFGPLGLDESNGGAPLRINGITFAKGLGVHAHSDVRYSLQGISATHFQAVIGPDDETLGDTQQQVSVRFQVWTDGVMRYESPVMRYGAQRIEVNVPLAGAQELRLVVNNGGDNINSDHADWCDAKLVSVTQPPPDPNPTIAELQAQIAALEAQLATLQTQNTSLQSQVTTLQQQNTSLQSQVTTAQQQLTAVQQQLSAAQAKIAQAVAILQ